jgi:hypothetical protein
MTEFWNPDIVSEGKNEEYVILKSIGLVYF